MSDQGTPIYLKNRQGPIEGMAEDDFYQGEVTETPSPILGESLAGTGAILDANGVRVDSMAKTEGEKIGLLPKPGWRKRNYHFVRNVLAPQWFMKRQRIDHTAEFPQVQSGEVSVTWIGHATFFLEFQQCRVLVDPNWALWHGPVKRIKDPGIPLRDLPPVDLVLITHAHFDHLHLPSLEHIAQGQIVVVPKGVGNLVKKFNFSRVIEMSWWDDVVFPEFGMELLFTPARHWGARMIADTHRHFGGFLMKSPGVNIYHAGDSALFDGFSEIGGSHGIDVALLPIGAYEAPSGRPVHMNPEEALDAFEMLGAQKAIPMHYGTFPLGGEPMEEPLQRFLDNAAQRQMAERIKILPEGKPWHWTGNVNPIPGINQA